LERIAILSFVFGFVACYYGDKVNEFKLKIESSFGSYLSPQILGDDDLFGDTILSIFNLYTLTHYKMDVFKSDDILMLGGKLKNSNMGFKPLINGIAYIVGFCWNKFENYVMDNYPNTSLLTGQVFIDSWISEVEEIRKKFNNQELYANDASLDKVSKLIHKGRELVIRIGGNREVLKFKMLLNDYVHKLEVIEKGLLSTNFRFNGVRQEPVAILLRGPPGCGKSLCMQHLAHAIAASTFSQEDFLEYQRQPSIFVYNRQAENVYWEGYDVNKRILFLDDLGQARDQAGMPDNEVMNVIRAINVFENQLHCAAIENKGNTTFRSSFVIANTNLANFNFESIVDKGAFERRWDYILDVSPLPQYCVDPNVSLWQRRMDVGKLPIVENDGIFTTSLGIDQLEFHLNKYNGNKIVPVGEVVTFDGVVRLILNRFNVKKAWHKQYLSGLESTLNGYKLQSNDRKPQYFDTFDITKYKLDEQHLPSYENLKLDFNKHQKFLYLLVECINRFNILFNKPVDITLLIYTILDLYIDQIDDIVLGGSIDITDSIGLQYLNYVDLFTPNYVPDNILKSNYELVLSSMKDSMDYGVVTIYSNFQKAVSTVLSYLPLDSVKQTISEFPTLAKIVVGTTVSSILIMQGIRMISGIFVDSGMSPESKPNNIKTHKIRRVKISSNPQSIFNGNDSVKQFVYGKARKNVYEVYFPLLPEEIKPHATHKAVGFMLMLKGYTGIMPLHFFSRLQHDRMNGLMGKEIVRFTKSCASDETYDISVDDFLDLWIEDPILYDNEIGLFVLPRSFRPASDITTSFLSNSEIQRLKQVSSILGIFPTGVDGDRNRFKELLVTTATLNGSHVIDDPDWESFTVKNTWKYSAPTVGGDCGSLLFHNSTRKPSIIGFHIAGVESLRVGVSAVLTVELINQILQLSNDNYKVQDFDNIEVVLDDAPNMTVEGRLQGGYPSSNGKTSIIKSPMFEKWGASKKKPARLKSFYMEGKLIDPMASAQRKYCIKDTYIPDNVLFDATISVEEMLYRNSSKFDSREILTFEIAVLGDDSGLLQSIPRSTSAGYPYSIMNGVKTKYRFFGFGEEYDLSNENCIRLRTEVDYIISCAKQGLRLNHFFTDCLKDELRKNDKAEKGVTRMFSACPTPLLIAVRMYFGSFLKWILRNAIRNGIAVGINEYSSDWQSVVDYLQELGVNKKNIGAGDYKGFDMSQIPRVQWCILDIINNWYGNSDDNAVRQILWFEVVNSRHIVKDQVTSWASSLGSGFALTWIINALYNHLAFRLSWMHVIEDRQFNDCVRLIVCGDDHVYSVAKSVSMTFTERAVQVAMENIGLKYQPEDKDKIECNDYLRKIEDVTFLKRSFVFDPVLRRYIAPLDLETILEIPYWVRNLSTIIFDTQTNIMTCLEELSLHSEDVFNEYYERIRNAVDEDPDLTSVYGLKQSVLRQNVLSRGSTSEGFRFVPQIGNSLIKVNNPTFRLQTNVNEFVNVKSLGLLDVGRQRSIQAYCQGAVVADPPNSRNSHRVLLQARSHFDICAAETNHNLHAHDATESLESKNGNFAMERIMAPDPFLVGSTTSASVDAESASAKMRKHIDINENLLSSLKTGVTQEVRDFLAKPQLITNGVFATTDTVPTSLFSYSVPGDFISQTLWFNKISGNMAFRATLVLVLQVNANRFQQGRYILAWYPDGGASYTNRPITYAGHTANLTQITQLPHVEIDVNCDSQAILEIPLVNHTGWYPLFAASGSYLASQGGYVFLRPYSPLVAPSGSTTATWSLYAYWKDVEFALPFVPQMVRGPRAKTQIKRKKRMEEIEQDEHIGGISTALATVATATQVLESVPLISSYAGMATWAFNIASKVASAFGLSKVHNNMDFNLMQRFVFPRMANSDTPDGSTKLAVFDSNAVDDLPGFAGSDLDESAIGYVATIPAWWNTGTWNESQAEGTALVVGNVLPRTFYVTSTYGSNTIYFPTPLAWVSNFFEYWRGGIKLTFKIVKTEFHTGRLLFVFSPSNYYMGSAATPPSIANTAYLHREIIDIRFGNEFSFVIPWASLNQYNGSSGGTIEGQTGTFYLYVLNPLVAPSTVSSSISILTEVSGADDIEFAAPKNFLDRPVYVTTPQVGSNTCEIVSTYVGDSKQINTIDAARMCIGEKVLSLKSLMKKFCLLAVGTPGTIGSTFVCLPFSVIADQISASNVLTTNVAVAPDVYSVILSSFALARGSVRLKFYQPPNDVQGSYVLNETVIATYTPAGNFVYGAGPSTGGGAGANIQLFDNVISHAEVEFPMYHRFFAWPIADNVYNDTGTLKSQFSYGAPRTVAQYTSTGTPTYINVFRAVGDDFSMGMFISVLGYESWLGTPQ
jgi:hypothetical protein